MIIYKSLKQNPSFKERFALLEKNEVQDRRIKLNQFEKILDYWNKMNEGQRKKIASEKSFSVDQVTKRLNIYTVVKSNYPLIKFILKQWHIVIN